MKISDLDPSEIKVGIKIKSLTSNKVGVITNINYSDDNYATVDFGDNLICGFYGNDCECELVLDYL